MIPPEGYETSFGEMPEYPDDRPSDGFAAWFQELEAAPNEDDLFGILAGPKPPTSRLARQQIRGRLVPLLKIKLEGFGSGASPARMADAWLLEGGGEPGDLQGEEFVVEETAPWNDVVDGVAALNEVAAIFDAYVLMSKEQRDALTLWTMFSHAFDCFGVAPILQLASPTKRCGKSSTVIVARYLYRSSLLSGNITPAALFRAIQAWKPTLLIDEADTFAKMHDELRGILNAGHTRDTAFVVRAEGESNEPRLFSTWAPKVVAAIGRLPDTIEDRAIRISLSRKPTTTSRRDAFDSDQVRRECEPVRRNLARFVLDNVDAIVTATVERPDVLDDRAWNNWRPLLQIASVTGGDWADRAERAARALAADRDDEQEDVATLALQHSWEVVGPAGRLPTADLLRHLVSKEEGPWAKWWEASVAKDELKSPAALLARLLKPFGVKPQQLWIDGAKHRGYDADDFKTDTVRVSLEKDGSEGSDGRSQSPSHAGSTVPTEPTVISGAGAKGHRLLPGYPGYLHKLSVTKENGHVTEGEWAQLKLVHQALARRAR